MQAQVTILPIICRAHFDGADFLPALLEGMNAVCQPDPFRARQIGY